MTPARGAPQQGARWQVVATGPWDEPGWQEPLVKVGCDVVIGRTFDRFPGETYSEAELGELLRAADAALVSTRDRITRGVLEAAPNLRIVAKASIGVEKIDLAAATDLGIVVSNSPSPDNFVGIAEASVGLILALVKRLPANQRHLRAGGWKEASRLGSLVAGKTVGIVGLGRVGANVARRLLGWDVRLLAADPFVEPAIAYAVGATLVPLEQLLEESDVVTLHVPLTRETHHLLDDAMLRRMKPTAYLVNTARGPVVDELALARLLNEGQLGGAALDVFATEPLPLDSPLRDVDPDRLILTPHCIGNNRASHASGTRMALESMTQALQGRVPRYVCNREVIPRWKERFGRESTGAR